MRDWPSLNWTRTEHALYESFWVLAQRFMIVNALSPYEFCYHFEQPEFKRKPVGGTHIYERLDTRRLAPFLGHSRRSIGATLPTPWEIGIRDAALRPLKLCVECAEQGYHTALFETGWLDVCPIHNRPLRRRCPFCRKLLSHTSYRHFGKAPGELACGHPWRSVSIRNPPQLDARSAGRLYDWVGRLKQSGSEEVWFGVSLHGECALRQDDQDFVELVDCLAAIAGLGADHDHHLAFWMRIILDDRCIETIVATLVQKHLLSSWYAKRSFECSQNFLDSVCRLWGAPLGCFQLRSGTLTGYWIKQFPRPNRLGRS